jgi:hypothetical protein
VYIPKGILVRIWKCCFNYPWRGNGEYKSLHLASWKKIALPKEFGGQGLKDIHKFGKALASILLWNVISKASMWSDILIGKHIAPDLLID